MSLGVKRHMRGKGLAKALLATSFNAFRDAGLTHTMIGVDEANPTAPSVSSRVFPLSPLSEGRTASVPPRSDNRRTWSKIGVVRYP
jgi:predicted GNAT family acetyltransferase